METIAAIIPLLILAIPISVVIRMVASLFSERIRDSIAQHPVAHLIWLAAGIAVVLLILFLPPLKRPSLKKVMGVMLPNTSRGCVKTIESKFGNDQIFDMANFDEMSRRIQWSENEFSHSLSLEPTGVAPSVQLSRAASQFGGGSVLGR